MNFLDIFNIVVRAVKPMHMEMTFATAMDQVLDDIGIDSLDGLMMMVYIGDIYGIDDEVSKDFHPRTVQQVYDFIQIHKTKEPQSLDELEEAVK